MNLTHTDEYDVVVIGGGAAGLSAALVLTRALRTVAVVDAGAPRNAPAAHMQGFLSRDGLPPQELLATGRGEVAGYGGVILAGRATSIEPRDATTFAVRLADGRQLTARRVLVSTGLTDQLPDIPGVGELWGRDVLHCPYCHGYEVRDQQVGVLGGHRTTVRLRPTGPAMGIRRHLLRRTAGHHDPSASISPRAPSASSRASRDPSSSRGRPAGAASTGRRPRDPAEAPCSSARASSPTTPCSPDSAAPSTRPAGSSPTHRGHERARHLGRRQRVQPTRPGHHRCRRGLRCGHRAERRSGRRRTWIGRFGPPIHGLDLSSH